MKKSGRKVLSVILTAVMVFALLPVFSLPMVVKADDVPQEHQAHDEKDDENDNCECHKGWKVIHNWDELKSLGEDGGSGYLVDNIEISETFSIESGKNVNLCLNGYSITQTADVDTIIVYGTLNLYDKKDNSGKITHASTKTGRGVMIRDNGTFTMTGGTISGNNATYFGGGVYNYNMGTFFTMTGGTISGNNAEYGGGEENRGTFTMMDGTISGNEADYGGGVDNYGIFTMTEGTISGNNANVDGGGVANVVTFTMTGGTISGNDANDHGGGVENYSGTFTMTEGTISGNNAKLGGGVYNSGTFTMEGGKIKDNKASFKGNGVYSNNSFVKEGGEIDGSIESVLGTFFTVTFNANNGSDKTIIQYVRSDKETNLASNKFSYGNYKFGCWNTKADGPGDTYQDEAELKNINSNLVLYARWIESYDVTFKVNNGSWFDKTNDDRVVTILRYVGENKELKLNASDIPTPENPAKGYKTGSWDAEPDTVNNLSENKEYTYTFAPIEYTVKYDSNGGEGTMEDQSRKYDDETALTANTFTLEGYTFKGWNTETNGNGTTYKDEEVNNLSSTEGEIVTLFAQWQANKYTVNYDSNGGVGTMDNQDRKYDDKVPLTANTFTLEGYTFKGWNTAADGRGTSYADKNDSNLSSTDGETVKLFAQWQANKYTVNYDSNGGVGTMDDQSRKYDDETALTANAFTYEGKTFDCWNTAADGSGKDNYSDGEIANISDKDNDTVTLYAQWTTNTFTVSWKNYDGTVLETDKNVAYGSTPSYDGETPVRAKEGNMEYTFSGWTPEVDTVKGAATYTATYSEKTVETTDPSEPQDPEVPAEPDPEIPAKDWLDDLRLALRIADELDGPQTVEYSGDFALSYDIMEYLKEHTDITLVYHVTYEGVTYTVTIPAGRAIADANIGWYGPLWLLANYGGDNVPEIIAGSGKYTVVAGDTLSAIAEKFGVTVDYLAKKNGIKNPDYIIVGQVIVY